MFVRRGTAGARMQEIAAEAGVNQALLHYYFRNKDQLAQAAFERAAKEFMPAVMQVLASDGELEDKVRRVVELELDHLSRAPYLPGYIIGEVTHHPERAAQLIAAVTGLAPQRSRPARARHAAPRRSTARVKAGTMRPIAPESFIVNLMALCIFPFAARPMIQAHARHRRSPLRAVHRPPARRPAGVLPGSAAAMSASARSAALPLSLIGRRAAARADAAGRGASRCSSARCSARRAPPMRATRELELLERRPSCGCATSTSSACRRSARSASRNTSPTCRRRRSPLPERPAGVRGAEVHLRRVAARRSAPLRRRDVSRGASWRAPSSPNRRRACAATLFALRQEVNDAFFAAALLQEQLGALDRDARRSRGAAARDDARACAKARRCRPTRRRSRRRCCSSASRPTRCAPTAARRSPASRRSPAAPIDAEAPCSRCPSSADRSRRRATALDAVRARPEYEQFDRARDRAARQQDVARRRDRPQLSAFGRAGYGRPGLNFISDRPEPTRSAGVQLQWKAWTWGSVGPRTRGARAAADDRVAPRKRRSRAALRRAIETDLATIDRLEASLPTDDRIVALRESIERTARVRLGEGVITASEYLDRHTEWLTAQFDRARHRVELAQARARVLTTLGLEVQ